MKQRFAIVIIGLLFCFQVTEAQRASGEMIVGKVFSKVDGDLIGVTISEVDGTNRVVSGTMTDVNGNFSLKIKSPGNKLRFSYLGYKQVVRSIGQAKNFNVEMLEENAISEVVVTARATTNTGTLAIPTRENTMSTQTIKAEFQDLSVASLDEALQGRIAGLDIVANSGDLGAGSAMRMRGVTSINASTTPLIVVNDIIYDSGNTDSFDFANSTNENFANLLQISVDDIESITVMKDGASTARWGSKGANGVISIRTKRGYRGKPKVQYTYRLTEKWQPDGMKMLNGDEYTMLMKEAYYNPRQSDAASNIKEFNYIQNDAVFPDWRMYDNNTDWVSAVKTRGIANDHYITLQGGGEKAKFYLSGGYYNEKGSIIGQNLNRLSSRMNLDYQVSDRILFKTDMSFTYTDEKKNYANSDLGIDNLLSIAYKKMPNLAIYRENENGVSTGEYYIVPQTMSDALEDQRKLYNPVAVADKAKYNVKSYRLIPQFSLRYDLLPAEDRQRLSITGLVSFNVGNNSTLSFLPRELNSLGWTDGSQNLSQYGNSKDYSTTGRLEITWIPKFSNENHSLSLYGSGEIYGGSSTSQSETSYGMASGIESPTTGSYTSSLSSSNGNSRGLYFTFDSHYSYKSKYSLGLAVRHEGSSRFGKDKRWGTFGGVSARWNISDESFMEPARTWLSMLAVRLSAGLTGNQPTKDYLYFSKYESWSSYAGSTTVRPSIIRLDNLQWEQTVDRNIGLNLGFLEDKFTFDFNMYRKVTSNMLFPDVAIPSSSGYATYANKNAGKQKNEGWELFFNLNKIIKSGKFYADFNLNFANNSNKVLELDPVILSGYNKDYGYGNGEYMSRLQLNNSIGSIYGFRYKGVYQYSVDNTNLIASGYSLGSAPVGRNADGSIIYDSKGTPVPMYFAYGTGSQLQFQGGDAIYEDVNHDGNINELDIVYLGNSNPKFNGGFGFKLVYDRLSVNVYSVFRYGNKIVNAARMNAESMIGNNNQSSSVNWRWRKEGDLTTIPRAWNNSSAAKGSLIDARNFLGSDRFVEDGSFWRINYVTINYTFPRKFLSNFGISYASMFMTLNNVYCFTKYSGVDPEVGYGSWGVSTDSNQTPRTRSFTAGLSVTF